jgi:DNA-binding SARP family transcriptional activator
MTAAVRFHLLRPLSAECGDQAIVVTGKPRLLLAALLLRSGAPVPHDRLAEIIWGDELPRNVRGSIHTVVSRLRAALGDHGDLIQGTTGGYVLEVGPDQLDLLQFRQLLAAADAVQEERRELALLHDALDLWREGALTGFDSDQLTREDLTELHELRLTALERRVALDLALGGQFDLVPELRRLVAQYPLRERLWSYLILALSQCGRQSDALAAYHEVHRLLDDQLGIRPGRELREAHQAVLLGQPVRRDAGPGDWLVSNQLPLRPPTSAGAAKRPNESTPYWPALPARSRSPSSPAFPVSVSLLWPSGSRTTPRTASPTASGSSNSQLPASLRVRRRQRWPTCSWRAESARKTYRPGCRRGPVCSAPD